MKEDTTGLFPKPDYGLGLGIVERDLQAEAKGWLFTRNSETKGHKQCCFRVQVRKCSSVHPDTVSHLPELVLSGPEHLHGLRLGISIVLRETNIFPIKESLLPQQFVLGSL